MKIFNLPKECKIDKNIPKEILSKNAEADEKLKRKYNIQIISSTYS